MMRQGGGGALFEREKDTLSALKIKANATIIFEAGAPLSGNEWQLNFRIITGNKTEPQGGGKDAVRSELYPVRVVPSVGGRCAHHFLVTSALTVHVPARVPVHRS